MSSTRMIRMDPSLSTARTTWVRINCCLQLLAGIKNALRRSTAKIRSLMADIRQEEGETLMKWRTRNPSTVLEIQFWNQVLELGEDLISREEDLGEFVTEHVALIRSLVRAVPSKHFEGRHTFELPSADSSPEPTDTGSNPNTVSSHSRNSSEEFSSEPEDEIEFDSHLSRSPSLNRELGTPPSEMTEPEQEARATPKTPTTFHNFPMLPPKLRLIIWELQASPPRCHRYYATINSLYELPTRPFIKTQDDESLWSTCAESRAAMFNIYGKERRYTQNNPPRQGAECYDGCLCFGRYFDRCVDQFAFEMGMYIYKFHFYYQLLKRLETMLDVERRDPEKKRPDLWAICADDLPKMKLKLLYEMMRGSYLYSWPRLHHSGYPGIDMAWPDLCGFSVCAL